MTGTSAIKIILGIDYGTTYSGVSYVTTDKSDAADVITLSSWPGVNITASKTPTRIAYHEENNKLGNVNKWGYQVTPKLKSYSWTKLLLDQDAEVCDHDDPALSDMFHEGRMKLPNFRDAAGVCEDFLHELFKHTSAKLAQTLSEETYNNTPMECWITLPAIWSEEAKSATLSAARNAGFGNRPGDEIFTIAEPEAAAIATLKQYSQSGALNAVKKNEHILICDCGGGTVDITTYTITQVEPRLEFEELCVGMGGKCGSTQIDRNLHTLFSKRFGQAFDGIPHKNTGPGSEFMNSFEQLKQDFGNSTDHAPMELELPLDFEDPESKYYDEEEGVIMLTFDDMKTVFDPVVSEVTNMVSHQVKLAEKKGALIDRIILVGGFGGSPYLNKTLKQWCQRNGNIALMCPENPQSAVVRGAALRGLEGLAPKIKQARMHYGVSVGKSFREGIDDEKHSFHFSLFNQKYCRHRMDWLISKGESISESTVKKTTIVTSIEPTEVKYFETTLYCTALAEAPEYSTHERVMKVGNIMSRIAPGEGFESATPIGYDEKQSKFVWGLDVDVQVRFGGKGENLTFANIVNGKVVSEATIDFSKK